jgi:hypothetical protein
MDSVDSGRAVHKGKDQSRAQRGVKGDLRHGGNWFTLRRNESLESTAGE